MIKKRELLKSVSLLWFSSVLGGMSAFFIQVLIARQLTPNDFGIFSASYSLIGLFIALAGFGVAQLWLKVYGEEGRGARRWLKGSFFQVIITSFLVISCLLLWVFVGPNEPRTQFMLLVLLPHLLGLVMLELMIAKYQLEARFSLVSFWQFFPNALRLMFVLSLLFLNKISLELIGLIYGIVGLALVLMSMKMLQKIIFGESEIKLAQKMVSKKEVDKNIVSQALVFSRAWPFGLAVFFQLIYYQSDIVLLKYLSGNTVAGEYSVAFIMLAVVFILPSVLYQKFLMPKIHYWANHDNAFLLSVYHKGNLYMLMLGLLSLFVIIFTSSWLVTLFFGLEYSQSITLLNILALSIPFIFLAYNSGAVLVTKNHMYRKVKYMGFVAVVNIVLNIIFIPSFGALGAAVTTVVSNILLFSLYGFAVKRYVF